MANNTENEWQKTYWAKIRLECLIHYSGGIPKCVCCGETEIKFLGIDHINNDGAKHRKQLSRGSRITYWLKRQGYPKGYQVMCHNCNLAKGFYGICPHKKHKNIVR